MTDHMIDSCILVITERGIERMTKRPGKLGPGERAISVRVAVPRAIFLDTMIRVDVAVPMPDVVNALAMLPSPNVKS